MLNLIRKWTAKPIILGRWSTTKTVEQIERISNYANCDSCGCCTVPEKKKDVKVINIKESSY